MSDEQLTAREKHDAGHELTDADIRELERGEAQEPATDDELELEHDDADTSAAAGEQYDENGDGTYTRVSDGKVGRFTPAGFEPYE